MLAGRPVASSIRFAARPVGAASRQRRPFARASVSTARRVWVLPVPGPPVRIATGEIRAMRTPASCSAASWSPCRSANHPKATVQSTLVKMRATDARAPVPCRA